MSHLWKILVCALLMLALGTALASGTDVKLNADAKFYKSASTGSDHAGLSKGTKLELKSVSGGWAKVEYRGVTGYMQVKYLNATDPKAAYVKEDTCVYKSASSSSSKKSVSKNTKVYVLGRDGDYARVRSESGSTGYIKQSKLSDSKVAESKSEGSTDWKSKVVKLKWFDGGSSVLKKGKYGYIYDIDTGITLRIKRMGGSNHADVEPATKEDTAKLLKIAGGSFSWDSQAVILHAGGKYVACAINTEPHGDQTISSNGYPGQFCLHMLGSKTHGTDTVNEEHQKAIARAYSWAH